MSDEDFRGVRERADRLYGQAEVEAAMNRMAAGIDEAFAGEVILYLPVLHGGLIPAGLLAPRLNVDIEQDYVHATRYRGDTTGSDLIWRARPLAPLAGRCVLVVDDILDEGLTLKAILQWCRDQGARRVASAVLVQKRHDRRVPGLQADFVGLEVPDRYVFGCGLDYRERFRNLPGIYAVADSDLQ